MLRMQQRPVFFVLIGWLLAFVFIPTNEPITRLTDTRLVTSVMRSSWWRSSTSGVCVSSRWRQRGLRIVHRVLQDWRRCCELLLLSSVIYLCFLHHCGALSAQWGLNDVRWFILWSFFCDFSTVNYNFLCLCDVFGSFMSLWDLIG